MNGNHKTRVLGRTKFDSCCGMPRFISCMYLVAVNTVRAHVLKVRSGADFGLTGVLNSSSYLTPLQWLVVFVLHYVPVQRTRLTFYCLYGWVRFRSSRSLQRVDVGQGAESLLGRPAQKNYSAECLQGTHIIQHASVRGAWIILDSGYKFTFGHFRV